ncbi:MAG: Type I restriction-modification system, specificity subunit S [Nitrospira sp.]|nr:MAG: Type I restriction-modification system, specificity subunit S [Nitrospira sp.]
MSWPSARLEDCCELITKGTTPTSVGCDFAGSGIPFLRVQDIVAGTVNYLEGTLFIDRKTDDVLSRSRIRPSDVLVSIAGTIGRVGVVPNDAPWLNCNQAVAIVRTRGTIHVPFLRHWLESPAAQAQMRGSTVTGTISNLSLTQLGNLRVPIPPVYEQRRIAEILDKADELRAKRRAAIAKLDTLTQSIFLDMFGDPATNPKGWSAVSIADICEVRGGKRLPKGKEYSEVPTPFRYIRVVDLKAGRVDESTLVFLKPDIQAEIARYIVNTGDVIISIAGSIGLVAPVPRSLDGANLTENAAKLVPRSSGVYEADYLAEFLKSDYAQGQINSHIGQVTIGKLALFRIEKINLPLPPIQFQREFVRRVAEVGVQADVQKVAQSRLDEFFISLQHRAFRGEI